MTVDPCVRATFAKEQINSSFDAPVVWVKPVAERSFREQVCMGRTDSAWTNIGQRHRAIVAAAHLCIREGTEVDRMDLEMLK